MTKGKLYEDIKNLRSRGDNKTTDIFTILNGAREDFLESYFDANNYDSMCDAMSEWSHKWFGSGDEE